MSDILFLDTETYSEMPLKRGTDIYARDPSTEIMILTYALGYDMPVRCVDFTAGEEMPDEFIDWYMDDSIQLLAHNRFFDATLIKHVWGIEVPVERWLCTMAQAYSCSLPGSLGALGPILDTPEEHRKLAGGRDLVQLFCKPRPKNHKLRRATRETHPQEWETFLTYAVHDTADMRNVHKALPHRNYVGVELDLWHLDQKINERGFHCDRALAEAAVTAMKAEKKRLNNETMELTGGDVERATMRDKLLLHLLTAYGVLLDNLQTDTLNKALDDDRLPEPVKELVRVRIKSGMTSHTKYNKLLQCIGPDGRLRGTLQFDGANRTGRWAGRIFQPQNLPRPDMIAAAVAAGIEALKAGVADLVYDLSRLCANALRGLVTAAKGCKLIVVDWSNIEGRVLAWLAGETWKLNAFKAYDTFVLDANGNKIPEGKDFKRAGPDLYKLIFSRSFAKKIADITDAERQIGKGEELSLGYGGGVGAFLSIAASYGLEIPWLARVIPKVADHGTYVASLKTYDWAVENNINTYGLTREEYAACECVKRLWRAANPAIVQFWKDLEDAARWVIEHPGDSRRVGKVVLQREGNWLTIQLPSGRCLMYASPRVSPRSGTISYMGTVGSNFRRIKTYGGKLAENITQAVARDVLGWKMLKVENELGYPIVLHVHDEIVAEVKDVPEYNYDTMANAMTSELPWSEGLPLAVDGKECYRYAK